MVLPSLKPKVDRVISSNVVYKYSCPHCDHQATQKGHLKRHIQSVHEGFKYSCPYCDHRSTQKANLKMVLTLI